MTPAQPVTTFWRLAGMSYLQVSGTENCRQMKLASLTVTKSDWVVADAIVVWRSDFSLRVSLLCWTQ